MESIIGFLLFFGEVFVIVLFAMLVYMKLARRRVEPGPEEKRVTASYMAGAPPEGNGQQGPD